MFTSDVHLCLIIGGTVVRRVHREAIEKTPWKVTKPVGGEAV